MASLEVSQWLKHHKLTDEAIRALIGNGYDEISLFVQFESNDLVTAANECNLKHSDKKKLEN